MSFEIDTRFIGSFKIGDNISYNARIVCDLYSATEAIGSKRLFKPKIVFNVSLIDAVFYDFIRRVRSHSAEFKYLDDDTRKKLRDIDISKLDTFKKHLNKFRHYKLIGNHPSLYDEIDELNKLRNRVHIQNEKGVFQKDDAAAFTTKRLRQAERCTEFVLKYVSVNYPRKDDYVGGIELPWQEHFDKKMKW
jgi:hypothetical protein